MGYGRGGLWYFGGRSQRRWPSPKCPPPHLTQLSPSSVPDSPTNSKPQTFEEGLLTRCYSLPIRARLASTLSLFQAPLPKGSLTALPAPCFRDPFRSPVAFLKG